MTEFSSGPGKRHRRVLEEIRRKLGIEVVAQLSPEETVTAEFDDLSLQEASKTLSTRYAYQADSDQTKREKL